MAHPLPVIEKLLTKDTINPRKERKDIENTRIAKKARKQETNTKAVNRH